MENLEKLSVAGAKLRELPGCLFSTEIVDLNAAENELTSLPTVPEGHPLRRLDVSNNKITKLPASLLKLPDLADLWINDNPLESLPPAIDKAERIRRFGRKRGCTRKKDESIGPVIERCLGKLPRR